MRSNKTTGFLIAAWFLVGLYSPSSIGGTYSIALWSGLLLALALLLVTALLHKDGMGSAYRVINSFMLVAVVLAATIVSPFPEYRWGGLLPYVVLALLLTVNLREWTATRSLRGALTVANLVNVFVGAAIILGSTSVSDTLVSHYSSFSPDLVSVMTAVRKPVLTFGSHSTAAFFYYLLFLMNFETYKVWRKPSSLAFAACYIVLCFALFSVSGLVFMSFATAQIFLYVTQNNWKLLIASAAVVLATATFLVERYIADLKVVVAYAGLAAEKAATSEVNGLSGRFSELGTLYSTVNYIADRPFSPVGMGYRTDLFFGDSGPVEYYLRGSLPLVLCIYGGLLVFLRRNLVSKRHAILLFFVILAFECGFTSLTYVRLLYLLPVVIVYLNDLSRANSENSFEIAPA